MKAQWLVLSEKIDRLSLRERAIVLLLVLAVFYLVWDVAVAGPQTKTHLSLQSQLSAHQSQLKAKQDELNLYTQLLAKGADRPEVKKQKRLQAELAKINEELAALSQGLVAADDLPRLLQDVLSHSKGLRLLSVQTLPVESLSLDDEIVGSRPDDSSNTENVKSIVLTVEPEQPDETLEAGVYKHNTSVRIRGNYFQVLDYVRALEALPWRFYWDWMDYAVSDYPQAEIEIRVYTLSAEEGLFGV
jgi:MSHA biogenesis protein MshJ